MDPQSGTFAATIEATGKLLPQQGSISHLLLVPSPIPVAPATSAPMSGIAPPLSQNSLPSLSSLGSLSSSAIRRSASGSQVPPSAASGLLSSSVHSSQFALKLKWFYDVRCIDC